MKRSEFLLAVYNVYCEASTDYLLALSDALKVIVLRRHNPNSKKLNEYEGYVKYI